MALKGLRFGVEEELCEILLQEANVINCYLTKSSHALPSGTATAGGTSSNSVLHIIPSNGVGSCNNSLYYISMIRTRLHGLKRRASDLDTQSAAGSL
jgi:hypothetical protein